MSLPGPTYSHAIPDLNWKDAVREARKKVAMDPRGSKGLQMMCPVAGCTVTDPMVLYKHPRNGREVYLCQHHWRLAQAEAREMQWRHQTLTQFLGGLAAKHGGNLRFASIGQASQASL